MEMDEANCTDGVTQTEYFQTNQEPLEDEAIENDENDYPKADLVQLNKNRNNSRKRVLEDITQEINKCPKLDQIIADTTSPENCDKSLQLSSHINQDVSNPDQNLKYYLVDPNCRFINTKSPEFDHENQENQPPQEFIIKQFYPENSSVKSSPEQQHSLDLSFKHASKDSTPEPSHPRKQKHVRIMAVTPSLSNTSSPEYMSSISPPSISPNDRNRYRLVNPVAVSSSTFLTPGLASTALLSRPGMTPTPIVSRSGRPQSACIGSQSGSYMYTPHPKSGQLFYISTGALPSDTGSPQLAPARIHTPETLTKDNVGAVITPETATPVSQLLPGVLSLNSSGEETLPQTSTDQTDNLCLDADELCLGLKKFVSRKSRYDLLNSPECVEDEPRETHNLKERRRRARIKDACDLMRSLIPGMSEKTDKATVFEFAARYIHFLKTFTGSHHDKDFLIKYSPY